MSNSIPVIKFMFQAEFKVFNDALDIQPRYKVENVSSANDLVTYLSTLPAGLVFASIKDKNDLIQLATFLKISKKVAKENIIKLVVFNFSGDKTYEKAVIKLGIHDLIDTSIKTKALKLKLDFWIKSLSAQIRSNAYAEAQKKNKAEANKSPDKKAGNNQTISWLEPLDLENDIWILKNDGDCKKVLSKWLIRLMGPSPYVGQWVEVQVSVWRFDLKDTEKELFLNGKGAWFFEGDQRPEFLWKENSWLITGRAFDLYFKDENQIVSRLKSTKRNLEICKNSKFAKNKQSIIEESFNKEVIFKRDAENLNDLEGKNKTEKIDGGHLSGRNNSSEKMDGGHLSGRNNSSDKIDGNLSGKTVGEEAIKGDNLSQKTESDKETSYWNGKNSSIPIEDGNFDMPKAEGLKNGLNLESDREDLDFQKNYKSHNEAQQYEALEANQKQARGEEEKSSGKGHLSGRSSTDIVEKNSDNSKAELEMKESSAKDNNLYGKSNTDKLNSNNDQKEKAAEDLDGKSSTDKLASEYANPKDAKSSSVEKEEKREKEISAIELVTKDRVERGKDEAKEREKKETAESTKAGMEKIQPRERQREEKEEQLNKERSGAALKNTTEASKQELNINDVVFKEKEKNKLLNQKGKATSRFEDQDEEYLGKSKVDKNREGENSYEMQDKSSSAKLADHDDNKKEVPYTKEKDISKPVVELANKKNITLPVVKSRNEITLKIAEEKELDELTRDANVISNLTQGSTTITCALDDFFEETIIFKTKEIGIKESQSVNLNIVFKFLEKDSRLLIQGAVSAVFDAGDGTNLITVNLSHESANSFKTFMRLYEIRQANVIDFLKKVKGI
jgi:hypothetical protein